MAVDCAKLKELGYLSVDDLPAGMLDGLDDATLAVVAAELPSRKVTVQATAIDYGKGKFPSRAALIAAASQIDAEYGEPGYAARESARQVWMQAMGGSLQAWDRVTDRLDGKPQQSVEMDVHMSLEQLIMASFKLESAQPETLGQTLDTVQIVSNVVKE